MYILFYYNNIYGTTICLFLRIVVWKNVEQTLQMGNIQYVDTRIILDL